MLPSRLSQLFSGTVIVKSLICITILKLLISQADCQTEQILQLFPNISHNPDDVSFHLFLPPSDSNHTQIIQFRNITSLKQSDFIPNILTVIFIHGYEDIVFNPRIGLRVMNAYLSSGIRGNFIAVGWDRLSSPSIGHTSENPLGIWEFATGYLEVLPNMPIVATRVTEFICWLCGMDVLKLDQLHIIGHSLGAHISGEVGSRLQHLRDGEKIWRITGLDPAGPLLEPPIILEQVLDKEDAAFVDAIHSSDGLFGDIITNGDVDIYVNNGVVQPGCWSLHLMDLLGCSHNFAIRVYVAGFKKEEVACKCSLLKYVLDGCHDPCIDPIIVGPYIDRSARGLFHIDTSANP